MTPDPARELALTLVTADGPADPQVLDDIIRLIRQGLATATTPPVPAVGPTRPAGPDEADVREAESQIKHRIAQDGTASELLVQRRATVAAQPDAAEKLAEEARLAADAVLSAVKAALMHGIRVERPADPPA